MKLFSFKSEKEEKRNKPARIDYNLKTDSGDRDVNEDCVGYKEKDGVYLFVLADGLGGHGKGDEASRLAVQTALSVFKKSDEQQWETLLATIFESVQAEVMRAQKQMKNTQGMKTTLNLVITDKNEALWGHIGDSRTYWFENEKMPTRTMDHSVPQMLVNSGEIKEKRIRGHEDRNRLLKVIGIEWDGPKYQLCESRFSVYQKDAILMCTDGFWELILEKQMLQCLKQSDKTLDWVRKMEKIVLERGKNKNKDNFSAIAIVFR